jgi:predicted RNase H-like HicB family nuclease
MLTLTFEVTMCRESGGYVARWDDPAGGGITTQGDSFAELDEMVRDAIDGYFADREKPAAVRLHFLDDPVLSVA